MEQVIRMNNNAKRFAAIIGVGLALMVPINTAFSDDNSELFANLTAEWWQWALSIPSSVNPQTDPTGDNAVVGQRGPIWFLAGVFGSVSGTASRSCSVPQGTALFFPVINAISFNSPGVCGLPTQGVSELRAISRAFIDKATNLSVTVDRIPIKNLRRVKSTVFEIALPKEICLELPVPDRSFLAYILLR
jgi:hypothetical protein